MKYKLDLKSDFPLENEFDEVVELMDDGSMTSKYAAIRVWMEEDQEGHLVIEGEWSTDDEFPVYDFMTIQFDSYDLSSALGELRSDFGLSFEGTFSIQEGDVIKTYDDLGNEV